MGACELFRPPVQGGSCELISKFLSSMTLYNHPSYFKRGEINSCELSPLPTHRCSALVLLKKPTLYVCPAMHFAMLRRMELVFGTGIGTDSLRFVTGVSK